MTDYVLEALEEYIRALVAEEIGRALHQPVGSHLVPEARQQLRDAIREELLP